MKYILDSDIMIYFLKGNEAVVEHVGNHDFTLIVTTIINHAELLFGAFNSTHKKQNLIRAHLLLSKMTILPFCEKASSIFAEQKAILRKEGKIIADLDLMIGSICLRHQMTLVTNNLRDFERIKHLKIENWSQP